MDTDVSCSSCLRVSWKRRQHLQQVCRSHTDAHTHKQEPVSATGSSQTRAASVKIQRVMCLDLLLLLCYGSAEKCHALQERRFVWELLIYLYSIYNVHGDSMNVLPSSNILRLACKIRSICLLQLWLLFFVFSPLTVKKTDVQLCHCAC